MRAARSHRHCKLGGGLALLALVAAAGCTTSDPEPSQPLAINLLIWNQDRLLLPIMARLQSFTRKTGIRVNVRGVSQLSSILVTSQNPNHDIDVVIGLNIAVGDFVNSGFIEPLDSYINADAADPDLSLATIPEGVNRKNRWAGRTYSMICDNDNMILIYRKDILGNETFRQAFLAEKGHPLPNPPQTIDDLIEVATWFNDKDWDNDGIKEKGFVIDRQITDSLMYDYALSFTTPYTVMPPEVVAAANEPTGLFLFKQDMTPLVNTPGFKRGLEKWLVMAKLSTDAPRQGVIDQMVNGEALMAIDWGDTGPASVTGNAAARGRLGFALAPGTTSYYNWLAMPPRWVDTTDVHFAPLNQANGFALYMTSTSEHKDAVWKFIKYINSPEVSMGIVSDPRGGYQPWRTSHNEVTRWVEQGWVREDAANYVATILNTTNDRNASLDIRIPGALAYGAVLQKHLVSLLMAQTPDIDAEMDACAAEMAQLTKDNQIDAQIAAYRAHLGRDQ